jgi:hypothetical protein
MLISLLDQAARQETKQEQFNKYPGTSQAHLEVSWETVMKNMQAGVNNRGRS